jgi:protein-tyrosine phosphatase
MITRADMRRDGADLVVTWSGPDTVTITVGPSPDDLGPFELTVDESGTARLVGVAASARRHYARLEAPDGSAVVAAERRLPMEGPVNFRDLGGYVTADGRRVRWDRVYRSDSLESLTDADIEALEGLGVRLVCDLRHDAERAVAPSAIQGHPHVRIEHLPIGGLAAETKGMSVRMMRGEIPEVGVEMMADVYATVLELHADSFGAVVAHAADPANLAMIVHCTAGKDRTGLASALILAALGVDEETVLADFELTAQYYSAAKIAEVRPQLEAAGIDFSKVETYFGASPAVMAATLAGLRARHGSIEAYLTGHAGVPSAAIDALRDQLLEP